MTYVLEIAEQIRQQVGPHRLPDADTRTLFEIYALLALTRGVETTRRDVHDAWVVWMLWRGEEHESMVPYENLPADVQAEDEPFAAAVRSVAAQFAATADRWYRPGRRRV